jgi:co-chaperonin GroES (HSP10)
MNYRPLENQVLLELHKFENKVNGIIIPDGVGEAKWYGIVLAFGNEAKKSDADVEVGDKVIYSVYGARELEKEKLIVVNLDDLLCVVDD